MGWSNFEFAPTPYTIWRFSRFAKRLPNKLHFWQCNQYLLGIWLICGSPIHKKSAGIFCQSYNCVQRV